METVKNRDVRSRASKILCQPVTFFQRTSHIYGSVYFSMKGFKIMHWFVQGFW